MTDLEKLEQLARGLPGESGAVLRERVAIVKLADYLENEWALDGCDERAAALRVLIDMVLSNEHNE